MGINKLAITFFLICCTVFLFAQNSLVKHTVAKGETVKSISAQYNITEDDIIKYNPDVVGGLKEGTILILPANKETRSTPTDIESFVWHTVQPKETIYGLCKQYNCTEEELLELNPELKDGLKEGAKIKCPIKSNVVPKANVEDRDSTKFFYHTVEPKETVYSICRAAGITEEEFLALNPIVSEKGLQIGLEIKLPKRATKTNNQVSENVPTDQSVKAKEYGLYRIQKGDDLASIAKKYNTTADEILQLNPELAQGLVEGKYIVVPAKNNVNSTYKDVSKRESLFWNLPENGNKIKVHYAVLLPFYFDENDSIFMQNSGGKPQTLEKSKVAFQFFSGLKLAMDTLASLGYEIKLDVYDTKNNAERVKRIAQKIDKNVDAIIGPLFSKNAEMLSEILKDKPIISPLSKTLNNANNPNLINCIPNLTSEFIAMAAYINKQGANSQIIFYNTDTPENRKALHLLETYLNARDSSQKPIKIWAIPTSGDYSIYKNHIVSGKKNIIISLDQDEAFLSAFLTSAAKRKDTLTTVVTTSKVFSINTLENRYLSNQSFLGMQTEFTNYTDTTTQLFISKFRAFTATEPNKFGFSGYDVGLYFTQLIGVNGTLPEIGHWPRIKATQKGFQFNNGIGSGPNNNYVYKVKVENFTLIPVSN